MIPSARPIVPPVAIIYAFGRFWKWGTDGRVKIVTVGRPSGSKISLSFYYMVNTRAFKQTKTSFSMGHTT